MFDLLHVFGFLVLPQNNTVYYYNILLLDSACVALVFLELICHLEVKHLNAFVSAFQVLDLKAYATGTRYQIPTKKWR